MNKSVEKEPFLQTLARKVGQTAGVIAKATQRATAGHAALVKRDKVHGNPTNKRRRSTAKSKSIVAKSAIRKPRARTSRRPD
jgi:hypothetical protein